MSVLIEFHPEAGREAVDAHEWYIERSENAAERFLAEVDHAIEQIREFPDRQYADQIKIVAVAHERRKPGYWKRRLTS